MNENQLSQRLQRVTDWVVPGKPLADIGSDHAYLPCFAVLSGKVPSAIAGEVVVGPYESAKSEVRRNGLSDRIDVRLGSGLLVLHKGEVSSITIAGMGGALIRDILVQGSHLLDGTERLVLQPNIAAHHIREWAVEHSYHIIGEDILEENDKIYEIVVLEKTENAVHYTREELIFGPFLMKKRAECWLKKWQHEIAQRERVINEILTRSKKSESNERIATLREESEWMRGVLK
ncbi:MAG: tRNA (adenine(22)-N(1))-methyltransferase [Bacilli bacterium]